jgi:cytochrome c-type biogenesis protein CcmI
MPDVTLWIALLMLTAAVALFVAAPLTEGLAVRRREAEGKDRTADLQHDRTLAVAAIRELEFDHEMGKIDDADFALIRASLEARALDAMQGLQAVSSRLTSAPERCGRCGAPAAGRARFCAACGKELTPTKAPAPAAQK